MSSYQLPDFTTISFVSLARPSISRRPGRLYLPNKLIQQHLLQHGAIHGHIFQSLYGYRQLAHACLFTQHTPADTAPFIYLIFHVCYELRWPRALPLHDATPPLSGRAVFPATKLSAAPRRQPSRAFAHRPRHGATWLMLKSHFCSLGRRQRALSHFEGADR